MRLHSSRASRVRAERRVRRGLRTVLATTGLATLGLGVGLVALPAQASTVAAPRVRLVGGNHMVTAAWNSVPGATRYTARFSTARSMAHAKVVTTTQLTAAATGLTNSHPYYIRVTATAPGFGAASIPSSVTSATPGRGVPLPVTGVTVRSGRRDQLLVAWHGGGRATKVAVIAGSTSMTEVDHFATSWRPATTHALTLTVPARLEHVLGAGTGNYVFVKVVQSNLTDADPVKHLLFNGPDLYRLSDPGTAGLAGNGVAPSAAVSHISVASWNVQGLTASGGFSWSNRWMQRRDRVVANIVSAAPDLIGMQELGTARTSTDCGNSGLSIRTGVGAHCREQYETLQSALDGTSYRNARSDAWHWVYGEPGGGYVESMLFYNHDVMSVVASGFLSPRTDLHVTGWGSQGDESGMWARFRITASGREFVAASIHLPAGDGAALATLRRNEANALAPFLDAKALQSDGTHLPIVLVGDLNSNGATESSAGSLALYRHGYFDTAATVPRGGARYSTSNGTNGTDGADPGYPVHAVIHRYETSRIDYVLTKNSPYTYRYDNLVRLVPGSNRFDPRYNGSDHNLQLARIGIADPH